MSAPSLTENRVVLEDLFLEDDPPCQTSKWRVEQHPATAAWYASGSCPRCGERGDALICDLCKNIIHSKTKMNCLACDHAGVMTDFFTKIRAI